MEENSEPRIDTRDDLPLVSIGVPVYNESKFINESLDSLLKQDYPNIEIIISDNASNDGTDHICLACAKKHHHIQFHRFTENRGPAKNFEFVLKKSKGKYFMWASGHDLWSPDFVSRCVEALESNLDSSIAMARTNWISDTGTRLPLRTGWTDTSGLNPVARYFTVLWGNMNPILGLIRKEHLKSITFPNAVGLDLIILAQLALKGDFVHTVETSWSRREFRNERSYGDKLQRYKSDEYRLATSFLSKHAPLALLPVFLLVDVMRSKTSWKIRVIITLLLIPTLPVKYICGKFLTKHETQ